MQMGKGAFLESVKRCVLAMGLFAAGAMLPLVSACGDDDDDATGTDDDDDDATATGDDDDDATATDDDDDDATATDDDDDATATGDDDDDATATGDDDDDVTATGDDDDVTATGDDDDATATGDDDDDAPTFATIQSEILNVSCVACHGGVVPRAGLDLSGAGAYDRLVNVKDSGTGLNYVTPGDAEASLLYKVLLASVPETPAGSVQKMPQGGSLSEEKIALMKAWIDAGAAR